MFCQQHCTQLLSLLKQCVEVDACATGRHGNPRSPLLRLFLFPSCLCLTWPLCSVTVEQASGLVCFSNPVTASTNVPAHE